MRGGGLSKIVPQGGPQQMHETTKANTETKKPTVNESWHMTSLRHSANKDATSIAPGKGQNQQPADATKNEKHFTICLERKLQQLRLEETKSMMIRFVAFNKASTLLAYGGFAKEISIIWTDTWEIVTQFTAKTGGKDFPVSFGEFSHDDRWFFWGGRNKNVVKMKVPYFDHTNATALKAEWPRTDMPVDFPLSWGTTDPESKVVLFGGKATGAAMKIVAIESWDVSKPLYEVNQPVTAGAFSPMGDCIIYAMGDSNELVRHNWPAFDSDEVKQKANGAVENLSIAPKGNFLAYCGDDQKVTIARTDNLDVVYEIPVDFEMRHIKFSPNGETLAYGGADKKITLVSAFTFGKIKEIHLDNEAESTDFNRDGLLLAFGGKDKMVTVASPDVWQVRHSKQINQTVHDVAFTRLPLEISSPQMQKSRRKCLHLVDSHHVCAVADEKMIQVFTMGEDGCKWELLKEIGKTGANGKRAISFSPNGRFLGRGGKNQEAVLHRTCDWEEVCQCPLGNDIMCVTFSPDSRYMVSGARNGKCVVVDTDKGKQIAELKVSKEVRCACFTPLLGLTKKRARDMTLDDLRIASLGSRPHTRTSTHDVKHQEYVPVPGRLKVFICSAENLPRCVDVCSKADPYCICELGGVSVQKTPNIPEGGGNPVWNHGPFELDWTGDQELCFKVKDQDILSDDHLGSARLSAEQISKGFDGHLELEGPQNCYGRIWVTVEFSPKHNDDPKRKIVSKAHDSVISNSACDEEAHPYFLAIGDGETHMVLFDTGSWSQKTSYDAGAALNTISFSQDGSLVALGGKDNKVSIFCTDFTDKGINNIQNWQQVYDFPCDSELMISSFSPTMISDFSSAGKGTYFAFGGKDRIMRLAVGGKSKEDWTLLKSQDVGAEVKGLNFSADGSLLGFGGSDNAVTILDLSVSPPEEPDEPSIHELHHWINHGHLSRIETVINKFPALLTFPNLKGNPALQACIHAQESDLAAKMLDAIPLLAYIQYDATEGETAFNIAFDMSDRIVVEALCRASLKTSNVYPEGICNLSNGLYNLAHVFKMDSFYGLAGDLFDHLDLVDVRCSVKKTQFTHVKRDVKTSCWDSPNRSGLWDSHASPSKDGGIPVVAQRTVWPDLGSIELLRVLVEQDDVRIFGSPTMQLVVTEMWERHVKKRFLKKFFLYLVYALVYSVAAQGMRTNIEEPDSIFSLFCQLVAIILAVLSMFHELKQGIERGLVNYLLEFWNWLDLSANLMVMTSIVLHTLRRMGVTDMSPDGSKPWNNSEALQTFLGFSFIVVYSNILQFLRGFDRSAALVQMLFTIFYDMSSFLYVMGIMILGFSMNFYFALKDTSDQVMEDSPMFFGEYDGALFQTIIMGMFGDLEAVNEVVSSSRYSGFNRFMLVTYLFMTLIIMLNALIAIMGDSYQRVNESLYATTLAQRAAMIVEFLEVEQNRHTDEIQRETRWFHVLMPKSKQKSDEQADSWTGQLNAMRREIKKNSDRVISKLEKHITDIPHQTERALTIEPQKTFKNTMRMTNVLNVMQPRKSSKDESGQPDGVSSVAGIPLQGNAQTASVDMVARVVEQIQLVEQRCDQRVTAMCEQMHKLQEQMQKNQQSNEDVCKWFSKLRDRKEKRAAQPSAQPSTDHPQHNGQLQDLHDDTEAVGPSHVEELS